MTFKEFLQAVYLTLGASSYLIATFITVIKYVYLSLTWRWLPVNLSITVCDIFDLLMATSITLSDQEDLATIHVISVAICYFGCQPDYSTPSRRYWKILTAIVYILLIRLLQWPTLHQVHFPSLEVVS